MTTTTIQINRSIRDILDGMRIHSRETYNDVLERIIEDFQEVNDETKKRIRKAMKDIDAGKFKSHAQLQKEMGF